MASVQQENKVILIKKRRNVKKYEKDFIHIMFFLLLVFYKEFKFYILFMFFVSFNLISVIEVLCFWA